MQSGGPWRRRSRLSHEIPWGLAVLRVAFSNDGYLHVFVPGVVHESHTWFVWITNVPNGKGCLFHPSPACFSPASQWLTSWTTLCKGYGFVKGKVVPWWRGIQRQDLFFFTLWDCRAASQSQQVSGLLCDASLGHYGLLDIPRTLKLI